MLLKVLVVMFGLYIAVHFAAMGYVFWADIETNEQIEKAVRETCSRPEQSYD